MGFSEMPLEQIPLPEADSKEKETKIDYILYKYKYCSVPLETTLKAMFAIYSISDFTYLETRDKTETDTKDLAWFLVDYKFNKELKCDTIRKVIEWLESREFRYSYQMPLF